MQFLSCSAAWFRIMPRLRSKLVLSALLVLFGGGLPTCARADDPQASKNRGVVLNIDATVPRVTVNPRMYGVFFEEINHAGDGGLYAELTFCSRAGN